MKKLFFILIFFINFLWAHKLNIFVDFKNNELILNAYFANGKPCKNCLIKLQTLDGKIIQRGKTDSKGEFYYNIDLKEFEIIVDGGSGHLAKEIVRNEEEALKNETSKRKFVNNELDRLRIENKKLKLKVKMLEKELNITQYLKIFLGLFLIIIIFILLKRFKK